MELQTSTKLSIVHCKKWFIIEIMKVSVENLEGENLEEETMAMGILIVAAESGHIEIVRLCKEYGAVMELQSSLWGLAAKGGQ